MHGEHWKVCWALRIGDKCEEGSVWKSNCTNNVEWSRGMGYEKCWEKKSECSWDECLRSLVGMSRTDCIMNEEVHRRAGIERELASRAHQRVLRWLGHVKRMDEYHMARRVLFAEVSGGWVWGRPRLGWMDVVKVAFGNGGMTVQAARQCARDRKEWRPLVQM